MEIALSIAALIIAIAFLILVIYLVKTLKATEKTLNNVADTIDSFEKQLQGITRETTSLLQKTNHLAEDISEKSTKLNTVFDGFKEIGETIQNLNASLNELTNNIAKVADEDRDQVSQVVKWGAAIIDIWKRRKS